MVLVGKVKFLLIIALAVWPFCDAQGGAGRTIVATEPHDFGRKSFRQLECRRTWLLKADGIIVENYTSPIISTSSGDLRGKTSKLNTQLCSVVNQYLGIPYALPPVKDKRWKLPEDIERQSGILDATKFQAICPQALGGPLPSVLLPVWYTPNNAFMRKFTMSENCLYLNVFVPIPFCQNEATCRKSIRKNSTLLPVMVYFHGHTFSEGSGNFYDGSMLALHGDVIVVTFNYRLGILGFLSASDVSLPGNYGLWDQIKALDWISKNIGNFGGDPERVTAFGGGSGAISIGLLMLSQNSENLFQQAILQSGSALAPWSIVKDPLKHAKTLWNHPNVNCDANSTQTRLECLRNKSWKDLMSTSIKTEPYQLVFGPVVDGGGGVITNTPDELIKSGEFIDYSVLIGVNQGDGFGYVRNRLKSCAVQDRLSPDFFLCSSQSVYKQRDFIIDVLDLVSSFYKKPQKMSSVQDVVQFVYTDWTAEKNTTSLKKSLLDVYTDRQWVEPAVRKADIQVKFHHPAYFYSFNHHCGDDSRSDWIVSAHGEELPFVFGAPLEPRLSPLFPFNFTDNDIMVSLAMMTYWTNFAKTGDPMKGRQKRISFNYDVDFYINNAFTSINWISYDAKNKSYLHISAQPKMMNHYRAEKIALWKEFLPRLEEIENRQRRINGELLRPVIPPSRPSRNPEWKPLPGTTKGGKASSSNKKDQSREGKTKSMQLILMVVIGLILILINIIVCAFATYKKAKNKKLINKLRSELKTFKAQSGILSKCDSTVRVSETEKHTESQQLTDNDIDDPHINRVPTNEKSKLHQSSSLLSQKSKSTVSSKYVPSANAAMLKPSQVASARESVVECSLKANDNITLCCHKNLPVSPVLDTPKDSRNDFSTTKRQEAFKWFAHSSSREAKGNGFQECENNTSCKSPNGFYNINYIDTSGSVQLEPPDPYSSDHSSLAAPCMQSAQSSTCFPNNTNVIEGKFTTSSTSSFENQNVRSLTTTSSLLRPSERSRSMVKNQTGIFHPYHTAPRSNYSQERIIPEQLNKQTTSHGEHCSNKSYSTLGSKNVSVGLLTLSPPLNFKDRMEVANPDHKLSIALDISTSVATKL